MVGEAEELTDIVGAACMGFELDPAGLRSLITAVFDVNIVLDGGWTPLHFAAMADWREEEDGRMAVLLEAGADTDARLCSLHRAGWTPLHLAAADGHDSQLRTLIKWGADVNSCDAVKRTPLILAVQGGRPVEKVEALLGAGADPTSRDDVGKTARDYSVELLGTMTSLDVEKRQATLDEQSDKVLSGLQSLSPAGKLAEGVGAAARLDAASDTRNRIENLKTVIELLDSSVRARGRLNPNT